MSTTGTLYAFVNDGRGGQIAVHAYRCRDTQRAEADGLSVWHIGSDSVTVAIRCDIGEAADIGQTFVPADYRVMPCVVQP